MHINVKLQMRMSIGRQNDAYKYDTNIRSGICSNKCSATTVNKVIFICPTNI